MGPLTRNAAFFCPIGRTCARYYGTRSSINSNPLSVARGHALQARMGRGSASWLNKIGVVQPTPAIDARVQGVVTDALLDNRRLEVRYRRKSEREARRYVLNPLALIKRGPLAYLLATVGDYDDVLMFALHRFERARIAAEKARRPKGFKLAAYLKDGWAHYGTGKSIRLDARFTAAAADHLQETPLADDQRISDEADGRVRVRATVADTPQLRWWLLGFGDAVTVQAPAELRQWFATTAASMAASYAAWVGAQDAAIVA
jgi:predicted DNA-binding transcriptional regulator YafY